MAEKKLIKVNDIKTDAEERNCPVEKSLFYITEFLSGPMCGKCFPCSMGTYEAGIILNNIIKGTGREKDLSNLKRIALEMLDGSKCKKGKDSARFILEWMDADAFSNHIEGKCPDRTCSAYIEYRIISDKCTLCGECLTACKYGAIHGEKREAFVSGYQPFEIKHAKCVKCGECIPVCPENVIIIVDAKIKDPVGV